MISASQSAQIKAADPHSSVWVSASAGTGKTKVLVSRILRLLLDGNAPEKLLCITYTKPAAAEILERISRAAAEWAICGDDKLQKSLTELLERTPNGNERTIARTLLPKILQAPGGMRIMTIHAFCQSVLSRFPLEAGINGNFEICDDQQSHDLLARAKQNLLTKTTPVSNPALFTALAFLYDRVDETIQDKLITNVIKKRHKLTLLRKQFPTFEEYRAHLCAEIGIPTNLTLHSLNESFLNAIPQQDLQRHADILLNCTKPTPKKTGQRILDYIAAPTIDAYCKIFLTQDDTVMVHLLSGIDPTAAVLINFLESESQRTFDYKQRAAALDLMLCSSSIYLCCISLLHEYAQIKRTANLLDYEDQILLTERLLTELSNTQWVLYKLDSGIDHLLLDEAQDTSPSQWAIVDKLVDEFFETPGNGSDRTRTVFVVGDEKQSIFSFQNADPASFALMKDLFKEKAAQRIHPYNDLSLIENYRSSSIILDLVDNVFKDENLRKSISHLDIPIKHEAFHKDAPGQIDVWPLVPLPEDKDNGPLPEQKLAREIAGHVENLLGQDEALQPGDFMILVRTRNPMVNPLVKAFKDLGIPVRSVDRLLLCDQLVVQDCVNALSVCLNPLDDYSLACFLKSPFIGLSEDELYKLAHRREKTLWESLTINPSYNYVLTYYLHLLQAARDNTPYRFFHTLISHPCPADTRSGKHALIKRLGYDAEDVLDQFLDTVTTYQQNNTFSNQAFITWLLGSEATTASQAGGAEKTHVRIMTVHGSKGLQAPIVFLADTHSKPRNYSSSLDVLWRETDNGFLWATEPGNAHPLFAEEKQNYLTNAFDEYHRLLYVALTRAQERLIVCGFEKDRAPLKEYKSWHDIISTAMQNLPYDKKTLPLFGKEGISAIKTSTKPSEKKQSSSEKKIYVIPKELLLKPAPEPLPHFPLRPSQLPGKPQPVFSPLSEVGTSNYKRGEILHKLFSVASNFDKEKQPEILNKILENYAPDPAQAKAYYDEVWAILSNNRFADLFSAKSRSEVPITGQIEWDGITYNVNGQIDRLLVEKDRVLIVDFKTNRPASMNPKDVSENYKFQLMAYKKILEKIYPDKKIETAILWTSVPYLLPLSL